MPRFTSRTSRYRRRRPYRRPTRRTRIVRRRTTTRRRPARISRRRILQIATTKKQDNRLTFSNVDSPAVAPTQKSVIMVGGVTYMIPYIPTAQDRSHAVGQNLDHYRDSDDVYMRGYKERLRFTTNNPTSWTHRRVCFTLKGNAIINSVSATSPLWLEASPNGWVRTATQANGTGLGTAITNEIFKGQVGVDWTNYFTAPLDTQRITVMYDKTFHYRSGNDQPHVHDVKLWHAMNKNFFYRDDEFGNNESTGVVHSSSRRGMGDYYIVDFFESLSQDTEDVAQLHYEGTLYWHER